MSPLVTSWNSPITPETARVDGQSQPVLTLLGMLLRPREVVELRILEARPGQDTGRVNLIANGYFDDPLALAQAATRFSSPSCLMYFTVNPVRRSLLYAAENHFRRPACWTTINRDVTRRCALVIKFEPVHNDEVAANDSAYQAAFARAGLCRDFLSDMGWPMPTVARSGSSVHLLYAIDLANKPESDGVIGNVLEALDERFSDSTIHVDTGAFNAALLCPLYSMPAHQTREIEESYQSSAILDIPGQLQPVGTALLEASPQWVSRHGTCIFRTPINHNVSTGSKMVNGTLLNASSNRVFAVLTPDVMTLWCSHIKL